MFTVNEKGHRVPIGHVIRWDEKREHTLPYGSPPAPKPPVLEWRVTEDTGDPILRVDLLVDGAVTPHWTRIHYSGWSMKKIAKRVSKVKTRMLARYNLCLRESGPVGGVK